MATVVDSNHEVGPSVGPFGRMDPEVLEGADLDQVPLGRNRFLKKLGGMCFGVAMAAAIDASPSAACTAGSIPQCGPSPRCCCCNAWSGCCDNGCTSRYSGCGNGYGWYTCYNHYQYFCADYWSGGDKCLCANPTGAHC
jgi:hypothetical protein